MILTFFLIIYDYVVLMIGHIYYYRFLHHLKKKANNKAQIEISICEE